MNLSLNTFTLFDTSLVHHLDLLAPLFEPYGCPSGTVVLQQGKPADYLYFIVSGRAEVTYKPYDGNSITVAYVEKSELFGWSAVVGSGYYSSSIIATEPLEAVRVNGHELRKFCSENLEAGRDLLECLANSVAYRWPYAYEQVMSLLSHGLVES